MIFEFYFSRVAFFSRGKTKKNPFYHQHFARAKHSCFISTNMKSKSARETGEFNPRRLSEFCPRSGIFYPRKKSKKWARNQKVGEKKSKKAEKSGRETCFLPEKKTKIWPKIGFSGTFAFLAQKKKHWTVASQSWEHCAKSQFKPAKLRKHKRVARLGFFSADAKNSPALSPEARHIGLPK